MDPRPAGWSLGFWLAYEWDASRGYKGSIGEVEALGRFLDEALAFDAARRGSAPEA